MMPMMHFRYQRDSVLRETVIAAFTLDEDVTLISPYYDSEMRGLPWR